MARPNKGPRLEINEFGVYQVQWTEAGRSKRKSLGTRDRATAQRKLAGFLDEMERREVAQARLKVGEILDFYMERHVTAKRADGVTPKVIDQGRLQIIAGYLRAHFGDTEVADLEPEDVEEYIELRRDGELGWVDGKGRHGFHEGASGTIRKELATLTAAVNFAVKKKRLPRAEAPVIELPEAAEPKDRWLTKAEADKLLTAALEWVPGVPKGKLPRLYRFVTLALETASRRRALEALTWFQVDMERRIIHLNPAGRRQTRKRRPDVPISQRLYPMLVRAKAEATTEYVLDHPGSVRIQYDRLVKRAGLSLPRPARGAPREAWEAYRRKKVTRHTLRHTWAVWAAQDGVPLLDIAGVMGDTLATVERHYLHHCPEHLRKAVDRRPVLDEAEEE